MKPRSSIASDGVLIFNSKGKLVISSPGALSIFNYSSKEFKDLSIKDLFVDVTSITDVNQQGQATKMPRKSQWKKIGVFNKAGEKFKINVSLNQLVGVDERFTIVFIGNPLNHERKLKETDSQLTNLETANRNLQEQIAKRKEIEQKLMMFHQLYDTMVHNFPDGVIGILNKEMEYVLIDGKDLNQIDLPALGLINGNLKKEDTKLAHETVRKIKRAFHGASVSFEVDTGDRFYNVTAVPLPDAKNEINEILCVLKNVTEKNRMEGVLKMALEKERELSELKSRFITMACHEFKTPLATILSSTFLLENYSGEEYDNEKLLHSNRIKRSVNNLNTILNEFLLIETQNGGDVKVVPVVVDIPKCVNDVILEVEPIKKHGQVIEYIHEGIETSIITDQHLLWSILTNLISNALKYSKQGDQVQVETEVKSGILTLNVKDHGIGIPEEEHKYVFERFHRAPNALNYEGTGLGLHIVRKNIALLNGSISFESELNKGTKFEVILPLFQQISSSLPPKFMKL